MVLNQYKDIQIVQIGAGGTGSWLVPLVSKFMNSIKLRSPVDHIFKYHIIDFDIVEQRNILRQNFIDWDITKHKVFALNNRYVFNFSEIFAYILKIKNRKVLSQLIQNLSLEVLKNRQKIVDALPVERLVILIGCVDNNNTRKIIYSVFNKINISNTTVIYIDSGNNLDNGQIITLARFNSLETLQQTSKTKKINFLKLFSEEQNVEQSCAFFGDQSLAINNLAASLILINLQRILINNEIPPTLIEFNSTGYCVF